MARKRGNKSPISSTKDSEDALAMSSEQTISNLADQLRHELKYSNRNLTEFVKNTFGNDSVSTPLEWKLKSGSKALFVEIELNYEQVKLDTFVDFEVNGRDQNYLTDESLSDLSSLQYQQFFPVVGRRVNNRIEFLDGSRRRMRFLKDNIPDKKLKVLLTENSITIDDAKALAKDIQSAKQHNLYEIGLRCDLLMKSDPSLGQASVAKIIGISQSYVSKAIKASQVSRSLLSIFPDLNLLKLADYENLAKLEKNYTEHELSIISGELLDLNIDNLEEFSKTNDIQAYTDSLLEQIKEKGKENKAKKTGAIVAPLASFSSKGIYARKKVNGRSFSYEFSRLSSLIQNDLDKAIADVLMKHNLEK